MECIAAFNLNAEDYDRWYHEAPGSLIFESEVKAIEPLLPKGVGIEVGAGTGVFSSRLGVTLGVDPALNMARLSKKKGLDVVRAVAEFLPIRGECLDYVLLVFTICFLENPVPSFEEIRRVLGKGGSLVLSFIPKDSSWGRLYEEKKVGDHVLYRYARLYTLEQVEEMLHGSGFEIAEGLGTLRQPPLEVTKVEEPSDELEPDSQYGLICLRATRLLS